MKLKMRLRLWQVYVSQSVSFHHLQKSTERLQNMKLPLSITSYKHDYLPVHPSLSQTVLKSLWVQLCSFLISDELNMNPGNDPFAFLFLFSLFYTTQEVHQERIALENQLEQLRPVTVLWPQDPSNSGWSFLPRSFLQLFQSNYLS